MVPKDTQRRLAALRQRVSYALEHFNDDGTNGDVPLADAMHWLESDLLSAIDDFEDEVRSQREPLSPIEELIWDALRGSRREWPALVELGGGASQGALRGSICSMRRKGWRISNHPDGGWFRPDAPPLANAPTRR